MAKNPYWINFNYNPWNNHTQDCAIRAIAAAIGLNYKAICKKLGVSYVNGKGLKRDRGIDLDQIEEKFADYFDIVEDYYDNFAFVPDEFADSKLNDQLQAFDDKNGIDWISGNTLNDFCHQFAGQGTFLVSLEPNPKAKDPIARSGGHIVCAKLDRNMPRQGFVDTWDSGDMRVDAYMRVVKPEPQDSPLHWRYDFGKHKFIV